RQHVEYERRVEARLLHHRERLRRGRTVQRDEEIGGELHHHRVAGPPDVGRPGQDRLQHRTPALVDGAIAADDYDAVTAGDLRAGPADRAIEEVTATRLGF